MTSAPPVAVPRPGLLDGVFAASLALSSVSVTGLPAVVDDLAVPAAVGSAALVVGILGALGLAASWIAATLQRGLVLLGLPLLAAGVLFWLLQTVESETLGWRLAVGVIGTIAAGFTTLGWLAMRRYARRTAAFLPLLLVGTVVVLVAPTHPVLVAGVVVGSVLPIAGAMLVQRRVAAG